MSHVLLDLLFDRCDYCLLLLRYRLVNRDDLYLIQLKNDPWFLSSNRSRLHDSTHLCALIDHHEMEALLDVQDAD